MTAGVIPSVQEKAEAVRRVLDGEPLPNVAAAYDVCVETVQRWMRNEKVINHMSDNVCDARELTAYIMSEYANLITEYRLRNKREIRKSRNRRQEQA